MIVRWKHYDRQAKAVWSSGESYMIVMRKQY